MVRKIGTKTVLIGQKKTDNNVKVAYFLKNNNWKLVFEGTFEGLKTFIDNLKKKEDKKEFRKMIAEMNGTSYKAACEDMGLTTI